MGNGYYQKLPKYADLYTTNCLTFSYSDWPANCYANRKPDCIGYSRCKYTNNSVYSDKYKHVCRAAANKHSYARAKRYGNNNAKPRTSRAKRYSNCSAYAHYAISHLSTDATVR